MIIERLLFFSLLVLVLLVIIIADKYIRKGKHKGPCDGI